MGLIDRFIFISETCIPFHKSISTLGKAIYSTNNKSWINYRNTPNNGYSRQLQWDKIHPSIPRCFIYKSDQWIVLTRYHASLVVRDVPRVFSDYTKKPMYTYFEDVKASDEMYFPTILAMALGDNGGNIDDNFEKEICKKCITYCDWEGMVNTKHPAMFQTLDEMRDVRGKILDGGYFFARKFKFKDNDHDGSTTSASSLTVDQWLDIIGALEKKKEGEEDKIQL